MTAIQANRARVLSELASRYAGEAMAALLQLGFLRRGFPGPAKQRSAAAGETYTVTRYVSDPALEAELTLEVELFVALDPARRGQAQARLSLTDCDTAGETRVLQEQLLFVSAPAQGPVSVFDDAALLAHVQAAAGAHLDEAQLGQLTTAFALSAQEQLSP